VDLVQVDVVVTAADGTRVRGLKASDFTLADRGRPQGIATFEEVSRGRAAEAARVPALPAAVRRDVATNQGAQADRLVVMVVDDLHIWKGRTDRAKEIARKVAADLGPASSMAVLFTSGERSTQVTRDPAILDAAIDTLKGRQSWRRPHQAVDTQKGGRIDPEAADPLAIVAANQQTVLQDFFDNMQQYTTLQDAARILGGGDARRKAFVLLSEGIGKDLSGIFGAMRPQGDAPDGGLTYATTGNLEALTVLPKNPYHAEALIDMMEAMRRSNVATYAIDPRGRVDSKDLARECFPAPGSGRDSCSEGMTDWESPVRQAQHGLEMIADASGGFAVTNTDDFTSGVARIVDDLDQYYLLGFYPSDSKGKGYRLLDVQVPGHPEWKLRFRRGYVAGGGTGGAPRNADPLTALSTGILPRTDLPLRLTAIASPGAADLTHLVLALEVSVPRRDLQGADGKVRDTLEYEVLVVDAKKSKVRSIGGLAAQLVLSPSADAGATPPDTIAYQVTHGLDVLPGRFEFRVSAMSGKLSKGGSVYFDMDVPDFRAALALGGIAIGYAEGARVPVAPSTQSRAGATVPFPLTLDREFASADTLRVHVEGVAPAGASMTAAIEVVDAASGRLVASPPPSVTAPPIVRLEAAIPLQGLTPGAYVLRAILRAGATQAVREAGFAVR
jgi:VWFA-related protein